MSIAHVTVTGGLTTSNPQTPACGPDVPACGPGYADSTALGGGVEAFPGSTVTSCTPLSRATARTPATRRPASRRSARRRSMPASFGDAAGIDNWGTMTLIGTIVTDNQASAVQSNGGGIVDEANARLGAAGARRVTGNTALGAAPRGASSGGGVFVAGGGAAHRRRELRRREQPPTWRGHDPASVSDAGRQTRTRRTRSAAGIISARRVGDDPQRRSSGTPSR